MKAGEYDHVLATIKWSTDYLIKCDLGGNAVVAQVGLGQQDHSYWRWVRQNAVIIREWLLC